jgi:hypothetical protein
LDEVFGSEAWRTEVVGAGMNERLDRTIPLIAAVVGAKWCTSAVRMAYPSSGHALRVAPPDESDDGHDLMKACAWSVITADRRRAPQ